jgi:hypothetical protein
MKDKALLRNKHYDEYSNCNASIIFDKNISDRERKVIPLTLAREKHHCSYREAVLSEENVIKETLRPIADTKQIRPITHASSKYDLHKKQPAVGKIDPIEEDLMVFDDDYMMTCSDRICSQCGNDHSFKNNFKGVKTSIDTVPEIFSKFFTSSTKSDYSKHEGESF